MELVIEGVIRRVLKPQEFPSGFRKCEVHVDVKNGEYTEILPVEFIKDMMDEALTLNPGDEVTMRCNVRGREWDGGEKGWRAFISLDCWKYEMTNKTIREKVMDKATQNPAQVNDFPF